MFYCLLFNTFIMIDCSRLRVQCVNRLLATEKLDLFKSSVKFSFNRDWFAFSLVFCFEFVHNIDDYWQCKYGNWGNTKHSFILRSSTSILKNPVAMLYRMVCCTSWRSRAKPSTSGATKRRKLFSKSSRLREIWVGID